MRRPELDAPASEWLVYADALQVAGDPYGELIGLAHAVLEERVTAEERDAVVRRHWTALLGEAPPHTDAYVFDWHHTGLRGVTITVRPDETDPVGPFLASPVAEHVRSIRLVGDSAGKPVDLTPAMSQLLASAPRTCTRFAFVDVQATRARMLVSTWFDPDENLVKLGSVEPFLGRANVLELHVADSHQLDFGNFAAERLEAFTLRCLRLAAFEDLTTARERLNGAKFENLQVFELWCVEVFFANLPAEDRPYVPIYSTPDYAARGDFDVGTSVGVDWNELSGLWATLARCPLKRLALTSVASGPTLLQALAQAGPFAHVEELDLSDGALGDGGAAWLRDTAPKTFPALRRVVLERTDLTDEDAASIRAAGYEVVHSHDASAPTYRYIVGQE